MPIAFAACEPAVLAKGFSHTEGDPMCCLTVAMVLMLLPGEIEADAIKGQGQVREVSGNTATVSVSTQERPAVGDKAEVYVELPDKNGVAILATGKVKELRGELVLVDLERKTGRVVKNSLVRFLSDVPMPAPPENENVGSSKVDSTPVNDEPRSTESRSDGSDSLADIAKRYQSAMFLVGDPEKGSGTAFVISRKHRLLATNAHVADIAKVGVLNETRSVYKVDRKWYHPHVVRLLDDGLTKVVSADPDDGEVVVDCPDLALLQLESVGPELPSEVELALPQDVYELQGSACGMMGYPGYQHDQRLWQKTGVFASATFMPGHVSRLTGFGHNPEAPPELRRLVHFSVQPYKGFSGSPVFRSNGQVVMILNHLHFKESEHGSITDFAYCVRIDALWELLDNANLSEWFDRRPIEPVRAGAYDVSAFDAQAERVRRAIRLNSEAAELSDRDRFTDASNRISEAIDVAPEYWRSYWQRGMITYRVLNHIGRLDPQDEVKRRQSALKDHKRAFDLYKQGHNRENVRVALDLARETISIARITGDRAAYNKVMVLLTELLDRAGDQKGYVLALRGSIKSNLKDHAGALEDLNEAIILDPDSTDFYKYRAKVKQRMGADFASDAQRAEEMHEREHVRPHKH
ncbi:MAG: serine protease [Pirellulales bacterium]|nr:serine protease [Pirellulales bacterium]